MATKPVILAVDDDLPVLRAVERDLRARYGEQYRIVAANSGARGARGGSPADPARQRRRASSWSTSACRR